MVRELEKWKERIHSDADYVSGYQTDLSEAQNHPYRLSLINGLIDVRSTLSHKYQHHLRAVKQAVTQAVDSLQFDNLEVSWVDRRDIMISKY